MCSFDNFTTAIYFTTITAIIHYKKWPVVDSKKFEVGYCLLEESHCNPTFLKVPICSTKLVAVIVLSARKNLQTSHPFKVNVLI